jgi:phage tail-like protein
MPEPREFPYPNFAFRVKIGTEDENAILAGFQEVSGLGAEVAYTEYRAGNSRENSPIKVGGMRKYGDVTLKRGVMGAVDLFGWLEAVGNGDRSKEKYRTTVAVTMVSEDRSTAILEWKLLNARPMKYTGPSLNGKSSDVAIEELVLSIEKMIVQAAA